MKWITFLHIYQPPDQMPDILERIVNESYRPLLKGFLERPHLKFTLNINATLTEQLAIAGYTDVIDAIATLLERGQCEMTESAKYHPFLPLTPHDEIVRQILLNRETNKKYFGDAYKPQGFFPPEMAYDKNVADALKDTDCQWIVLDEIAQPREPHTFDHAFKIKNSDLRVVFRNRAVSNMIMSGSVRTFDSLQEKLSPELRASGYLLTAMDGETFGHHRPGHEAVLFAFMESVATNHVADIIAARPDTPQGRTCKETEPRPSTWAVSEKDMQNGTQFLSWNDPSNVIHKTQWEFTQWAAEYVRAHPEAAASRAKFDEAVHSCQYWWASAKPWWSLEMIESGAHRLKEVILANPRHTTDDKNRAEKYYQTIVLTAFEWQRTGAIRERAKSRSENVRIPLKKQMRDDGDGAGYKGLLALLRIQMRKAAEREEFEQAILWRDAILKLERHLDIYDAMHAIDLLRTKIPNEEVDRFLENYRKQYRDIRAGQPEQRD